ncbi:SDR family NAD(P)-dependent oxidoreductase [Roseovarius salis]|uniref:SDR family NAD(P)-dependent oxidoreductase n=1 Tax=Roseovarius salis TaxID=3376063 RepID=UPI0037C8EB3F
MHVVITGANRGIGRALHDRYTAQGHTVTGTARAGGEFTELDVMRPEQHRTLARSLDGQAVDLLICNAGIYPDKGQSLADGFSPETWAQTMATNVTGVFLSIQALLPALQQAGGGKIAIMSSRLGSQELAAGGSYAYRASKAAALNLGRNLAVDLQPLGIAVGIYHPGWVRTGMGGDAAEIGVDESADGLIREFAALNIERTGCFRTWDGRDLPF